MVAIAARPEPVPGLPPYDPDQSMSLAAACRLGFVPGHDGRRATAAEVRKWAQTGFAVGPLGPGFLFPAARVGGALRTTVPWCCAWVRFIAGVRAAAVPHRDLSPRPADAGKAA
jgi:hypothetical protein